MSKITTGMLAKSLAGHDEGTIYLVLAVDGDYVFLSDGRLKTADKLKRKNRKHIQVIHNNINIEETHEIEEIQNLAEKNNLIRKIIKKYISAQ